MLLAFTCARKPLYFGFDRREIVGDQRVEQGHGRVADRVLIVGIAVGAEAEAAAECQAAQGRARREQVGQEAGDGVPGIPER